MVRADKERGPKDWRGTHIQFRYLGPSPSGKTHLWSVATEEGLSLGTVRWFARWRKYCFYPESGCVFEEVCLRDIAEFVAARTEEHRGKP